MKRITSLAVALILLCAILPGAAADTEPKEYSDSIYSFRYPSSWTQGMANDGTIILSVPNSSNGVLTFAVNTNLALITGDTEHDRSFIEGRIGQYSDGANSSLRLTDKYESVVISNLVGYRIFGKWAGQYDAEFIELSDGEAWIVFIFVGGKAIAQEQAILNSVRTVRIEQGAAAEGEYSIWRGEGFTVWYPDSYGILGMDQGIVFARQAEEKATDIYAVRTYNLDMEYTDSMAPWIATQKLPSSTQAASDPVMTRVGDWNAAVIHGEIDMGPIAFYVIGKGKIALGLIFMGEDAVNRAETIVASTVIE